MTFATFSAPKITTVSGSSHTVNYHTSGESSYSSGDLLICIAGTDGSGDTTAYPTGDWNDNEFIDVNNTVGVNVSYIFSNGTENDGTFTCTPTSNEASTYVLFHISGAHASSAPEGWVNASQNSSDNWAAMGALNPTGWDVEDTLWIGALITDQGSQTVTTFPSELPDNQANYGTSSSFPTIAVCSDDEATASFSTALVDPSMSGSDQHREILIAVRPDGGGGVIEAGTLLILGVG